MRATLSNVSASRIDFGRCVGADDLDAVTGATTARRVHRGRHPGTGTALLIGRVAGVGSTGINSGSTFALLDGLRVSVDIAPDDAGGSARIHHVSPRRTPPDPARARRRRPPLQTPRHRVAGPHRNPPRLVPHVLWLSYLDTSGPTPTFTTQPCTPPNTHHHSPRRPRLNAKPYGETEQTRHPQPPTQPRNDNRVTRSPRHNRITAKTTSEPQRQSAKVDSGLRSRKGIYSPRSWSSTRRSRFVGRPLPRSLVGTPRTWSRSGGGGLRSIMQSAAIAAPTRVSMTRTTSTTRCH